MESPQHYLLTLYPVLLLLCFSIHSATAAAGATPSNGADFVRTSCNVSLYPTLCYATISPFANSINNSMALLAETAISVSLKKSKSAAAYVARQTLVIDSKAAASVEHCLSNLMDAENKARDALKQMKEIVGMPVESAKFKASNVQTWMSAALTNLGTCVDGLKEVGEGPVKAEVIRKAGAAKKVTSNALALINKYLNA